VAGNDDVPRDDETEPAGPSVPDLPAPADPRRVDAMEVADATESAESFELPGADLSHEELSVRVVPRQADEFTCSTCFLVRHHSQLAYLRDDRPVCAECAAES
jgi:hypothetical protein